MSNPSSSCDGRSGPDERYSVDNFGLPPDPDPARTHGRRDITVNASVPLMVMFPLGPELLADSGFYPPYHVPSMIRCDFVATKHELAATGCKNWWVFWRQIKKNGRHWARAGGSGSPPAHHSSGASSTMPQKQPGLARSAADADQQGILSRVSS
ncbi:hypothetical protein B0H17DRAFT_1141414 [Mycena rosella]|uniref:Uncharacterized protein n=1 Tax=Mycena rosella TaxID=1033263 RepID=A0AAD7CZP4_MYCRO|nr:hypothetical protein B0H17DRAFT_1141414 [Mycena rosella]